LSAIIIKADDKSIKILIELAINLGAVVVNISSDQYEDMVLGLMMESERTGQAITRADDFKKLK
jgi:hypothetical protein